MSGVILSISQVLGPNGLTPREAESAHARSELPLTPPTPRNSRKASALRATSDVVAKIGVRAFCVAINPFCPCYNVLFSDSSSESVPDEVGSSVEERGCW